MFESRIERMFVYQLCPVSRVCKESAYRATIHNVTDDDDDNTTNSATVLITDDI